LFPVLKLAEEIRGFADCLRIHRRTETAVAEQSICQPRITIRQFNLQKELQMLVLSRQRDESIMIGDDVEITIVDVRGDKVRLGITAPKHISVHRKEVYEAIQREKKEAAQKQKQQ
jgi:carbon storage regulator